MYQESELTVFIIIIIISLYTVSMFSGEYNTRNPAK